MNRAIGLLTLMLLSVAAYGHVVVRPGQAKVGETQTYTMRVPNEKQVATTRVVLTFPTELTVANVEEKSGWKVEIARDSSGKALNATWTGSLPPGESVEFTFRAKNPAMPTTVEWKAVQSYQDGTIVEWTGAAGSKTPASRTTIGN